MEVSALHRLFPMRWHDVVISGAQSGSHLQFVRNITQDLLGREVRETEAKEWLDQIATGSSFSSIVSCLLHSQERRERIIVDYYHRFLDRAPNQDGLQLWTGLLALGKSYDEILVAILSSNEYFGRAGATHEGFVRGLIRDAFQRKPHEMEIDSWVGFLNSLSATREAVALDFVTHREFRASLIKEWFKKFLKRNPDPVNMRESLTRLDHGHSLEEIQRDILVGQEYLDRLAK